MNLEDLNQFKSLLDLAEERLAQALEYSPEEVHLKAIRRQLTTAFDATRLGHTLSLETIRRFSFGLLADRVKNTEPDLSLLLSRLANLLDNG